MPDSEKVIKALECCTAYYIDNDLTGHERCPYNGRNDGDGCNKLYADALALIKEQEHKDRMFHALEDDWKRLKELLKEQQERIETLESLRRIEQEGR